MIRLSTRRGARGASIVEFAIVFPLAVLFVLSLIQVGFLHMAKLTLNQATFMAARAGAMNNGRREVMDAVLVRGLSPFYQDSTIADEKTRLTKAFLAAQVDKAMPWGAKIDALSPSKEAFDDFGVKDPKTKVVYIPNDNLEWRTLGVGAKSKVNIRDANLLKIRVTYGYEMKVPLIAGVIARTMCGGSIGVEAFGNVSLLESLYGIRHPILCAQYFNRGRIPIESVAIVEMQSPAHKP
jgi:TadE-like protein